MGSIRVDYASERFMIIYEGDDSGMGANSAYASGNEKKTNPSMLSLVIKDGILRRQQDIDGQIVKGWAVRVFESKNPVVSVSAGNDYGKEPFESQPAYGHHLVLVASPDPTKTLATIDSEQWSNTLVVVQDRLRWLYTQKGVAYVAVYADHVGGLRGRSKVHPHLNIVSFKVIPPTVNDEMESYKRTQEKRGTCPTCHIIEGDDQLRRVLQTESFVAYCPWSPTYPFEFCIAPKRHAVSFAKMSQKEIEDLALMIRATLGGLASLIKNVTFSMVFHLSAERKSSRLMHWHIEVYPVTKQWSGMERGYGIHLNDVSPEDAAKKLGASCRKELANMVGIG